MLAVGVAVYSANLYLLTALQKSEHTKEVVAVGIWWSEQLCSPHVGLSPLQSLLCPVEQDGQHFPASQDAWRTNAVQLSALRCWAAGKVWAARDGQADGKRLACKGLV